MYCPCCDKQGLNAYRKWKVRSKTNLDCSQWHMPWHRACVRNGAYHFYGTDDIDDGCQCLGAEVDDDNVWCKCGTSRRYRVQYILLKDAFYCDVKKGVNLEFWAQTFPRRVGEVMEKYKKATASALNLPVVIIEIIVSYQWV